MNYKNRKEIPNLPRKAAVIAVALAFSTAVWAEEDDEVARLIKPESTISVGIGHVSGDNQRFGMYNGLNEAGYVGLIDFSVVRRDNESGTWYRAFGRNLGLDNRELGIEVERAGKWGVLFNYDEITRNSPYNVWTDNRDIGSATTTNATTTTAGRTLYNLKTERQKVSFGFNAALLSNLEFKLLFQNEQKEGQRLFGRGTGTTQEFLAEPIDSTIRQIDAVLDYTGESLQLSGGYYGSFYSNANSALKVLGGNSAFNTATPTTVAAGGPTVALDTFSLPPDNYAHQFHLAGGYQFTKSTRMNFKIAKSIAIQEDDFISARYFNALGTGANANNSGRTDLGGRVDTTLVKIGLTSRPLTNLTLLGDVRYEDRDDKTAIAQYITGQRAGSTPTAPLLLVPMAGTSTTDGQNEPRSITNTSGKLEASYLLPEGFRLTGGYDIDQKERSVDGVRVVGYREKTQEDTYRLEVKRTIADALTGSFAYLHSNRDGSDYKNLVTLNGTNNYPNYTAATCGQPLNNTTRVTRCGLIQPIYMADRERDRIRFLADWAPTDQLSAQFGVETSDDTYGPGRGSPDIGVRQGQARLYTIDLAYTFSEKLKLNGWYSRSSASIDQATISSANAVSTGSAALWSSNQANKVDTFGIGVRAKLPLNIDGGVDYLYSYDKTSYVMSRDQYTFFQTPAAAPGVLPDITYRQNTLRMFGAYNIDKDMKVRLDYIFDNRKADDWTWAGYQYSDGTRVSANAEDTVHFFGISLSYAFR